VSRASLDGLGLFAARTAQPTIASIGKRQSRFIAVWLGLASPFPSSALCSQTYFGALYEVHKNDGTA
jgi:hypothetical protein